MAKYCVAPNVVVTPGTPEPQSTSFSTSPNPVILLDRSLSYDEEDDVELNLDDPNFPYRNKDVSRKEYKKI